MPRTRPLLLLIVMLAPAVRPLTAQEVPPAHWQWITDRPAEPQHGSGPVTDSTFTFVEMAPGWHVTMGPGGVLFDPRYFADGEFTVESKIFHFPNSSSAEYGLVVGGAGLDGAAARYVAFVLRGDGSVAVWEARAGERRMLVDWTRAEAVIPADGKSVIANQLKVSVSGREAVFRANGLQVLVLPLEGLSLAGQFGIRIGAGVNLHVATLTTTLKLAPVPAPR